ncbi:MAG: FAD-dependent oxidoreductase, partial [Candidatus Latescibacteria bacterium]|nr:FAD-dependent oxidoreductase [Candidatus Latescibacterota bacterium]
MNGIDRSRTLTLTYEHRRIPAHPGQTIAGALYAAGIRIFSRSFKYHRPRGLLCVAGRCPNCLMNVNGEPNVRTCVTPVADGQHVRGQNAWPSLETDVLSLIETFDWFLPVGFYYKTFIRPRSLWPTYETILRHIAGLGEIDINTVPDVHYDQRYRHTDVAVIGGGPAGLSAALEAAAAGADVTVVDDQPALGGHLRVDSRMRSLADDVAAQPNIETLSAAAAFGDYEGGLIGVIQGARLIQLRTQRTIIATGRFEHPLIFQNNDLPGVMLGSGVQRFLHLDGVTPGEAALVVTTNDSGLAVAADLLQAGARVETVVDARPAIPETPAVRLLNRMGVPILLSHSILEASGHHHVSGATVVQLDEHGHPVHGSERYVGCDLIALSTGFEPAA